MSWGAIFTYTQPMSEKAHDARDKALDAVKDLEGVYVDCMLLKELTSELENTFKSAESKLLNMVKKAGLKPIGRPDISYSINGGRSSYKAAPLSMSFSIGAEG